MPSIGALLVISCPYTTTSGAWRKGIRQIPCLIDIIPARMQGGVDGETGLLGYHHLTAYMLIFRGMRL